MRVIKSPRFEEEIEVITDFISENSPRRALRFYDELLNKLESIPSNPYRFRKRPKINDKNIRELIFKGYTIPFYIDTAHEVIVILGIFSANEWEL
ncbi:MAG: type II toxin-antitoxin system RelE/ParE family toxin [Sulfuricurvum sp.]|nr:type II toxin-antitoxin system RelE/ParE family toxin [Sulfuricurvum sp.]